MKYFKSEIEGKKISDFQKYDASITKYEDRLELVLDLLNDDMGELHKFLIEYFDEYYDASPTQKGWMAEQDIVCKTLEMLGTYLLNAKDIESNRKIVYRFWKSQREFKKYKESQNVNTSTLEAGLEDGVEVIDMFFSPNDKNYRMDDSQRLFARDMKDIKEIASLQEGIDKVRDEEYKKKVERHIDKVLPTLTNPDDIETLKRIRKNVGVYLDKWASNMADNQVLIKEVVKKPIRFRNTSGSQGHDITNDITLADEKVVNALITHYEKVDITSDVGLLVEELDEILEEMTNLTKDELEVIDLFKKGYTRQSVVKLLGMKQYQMTRMLSKISRKISKYFTGE